ncbi:MAG: hypothetical protein AAGA96_06390 [Verrucomicrobiota bacterium]
MTYQDLLGIAGHFSGTLPSRSRAVDSSPSNPDHHLWNNRGTWWAHFTVHHADHTAERVRVSLRTKSVIEARQRRDEVLQAMA